MVFQNYALYPHMSVFDNIAFPLRARRVPKAEVQERVKRVADTLGLTEYLPRKPRTLSGGQRQRVAMGRALVREPQAFLMDEPLSNLDAKLRVQMRSEISTLQKELGITTMYVTHDQVEAMTMGTRIAVIRKGLLQQYGSPQEVYSNPANIFVATFIGSPGMNFVKARVEGKGDRYRLALQNQTMELPAEVADRCPGLASYLDRNVVLGVRPEHLSLGGSQGPSFTATVTRTELLGAESLIHVVTAAESVLTDDVVEALADIDVTAVESLEEEQKECRVNLVVRADSSTVVTVGETVELAVRPAGMHFFALEGGQAITT